jgi:hypothetical protein
MWLKYNNQMVDWLVKSCYNRGMNSKEHTMKIFIVEYTTDNDKCLQMEIEAPNLETAYEIVNQHYSDVIIDNIYGA